MLAFVLAGLAAVIMHLNSLPSIDQIEQYEPTLTSQITSNDNQVIRTFGAYKYQKVNINQIPEYLKEAIVATEDQNFYHHHGFDVIALIRSTIKNMKAGKAVQGASTITQQLARVLFLTQEKTMSRKFKELIIAYRLEKTLPKDKILEMYLNNIYLGEGAYGVAAAADIYFNKRIQDLTLAECALFAGLPQAPSVYSPFRNPDLAKKRRSMVLKRMVAEGYISQKQADKADAAPFNLNPDSQANTLRKAPYFIDFVMKELTEKTNLTEEDIIQGGYKIYTTLNYESQKVAERVVREELAAWGLNKPWEQAALISYDVVSGQILAYVGGKNYNDSQFDRVSLSIRQPGSSFKVFVYTTAMEQGMTPFTVYNDAPVRIGNWAPNNYGGKFRGPLPLYKALAYSSNTVAVQLIRDVGVEEVIKTARKMGITTPLQKDPTISLGSNGVKPIEMATAYGVLANGGIKVKPYAIERIETSNGKVIYVANNSYQRVLSVKTVAYMVEMMKQVVKAGTARGADIGRPSAGKTGTTDSYRDAWYVGFTPDIVTAVWVGNDNNTSSSRGLTGGTLPAIMWKKYMAEVTKDRPVIDFMYPEVIVDGKDEQDANDVSEEADEKNINQKKDGSSEEVEMIKTDLKNIFDENKVENSLKTKDTDSKEANNTENNTNNKDEREDSTEQQENAEMHKTPVPPPARGKNFVPPPVIRDREKAAGVSGL